MYTKYQRKEAIHVFVYPYAHHNHACSAGYGNRIVNSCVLAAGGLCKQAGLLSGKGLSREIKEISTWALGITDKFVHHFSIEV